jgi:Ca2+:H+ antiporter
VTIILYGVFLYTQTIRHRDYFIIESDGAGDDAAHTSNRTLMLSMALLLLSLLAVVLLAKKFSLVVDAGAAAIGAPPAFAGILVALLMRARTICRRASIWRWARRWPPSG